MFCHGKSSVFGSSSYGENMLKFLPFFLCRAVCNFVTQLFVRVCIFIYFQTIWKPMIVLFIIVFIAIEIHRQSLLPTMLGSVLPPSLLLL